MTISPSTSDGVDAERLAEAIDEAGDARILLMSLVHLTGDTSWLEPPFTPVRDVNLIADRHAGLDADSRARIRDALVGELTSPSRDSGGVEPAIVDPGPDLMLRMMRVCLGEEVAEEYSLMMREDLGFVDRDVDLPPVPDEVDGPVAVIVGAGVSGLAMGAVLGRAGLPYVIVEKSDDVGGTWWDNRYPGCGVDTPNHAYSFSHGRRYDWSRYFSPRDEIADYLRRCADEFGVRPHIRFGTEVVGARWDDDARRWHVDVRPTRAGPDAPTETLTAPAFVSAVGVLNVPKPPAIEGLDDYQGVMFHTARWRDDVALDGADVAVVGTGASAMQLVPSIADRVGRLTVYQRSPQWARPVDGYGEAIPDAGRWLLQNVPFYAEWFRFVMFWRYGDGLLPFLRRDPEWPHPERSMNRINDRHRGQMTDHLLSELEGRPDLVDKCLPSYPPFGKRILLDNGWFRTVRRDDVELVTDPIDHVDGDGVVTTDGTHRRHDVILQATGFETTQLTARLGVIGRDGLDLADAWADEDPRAHIGITVPGFPNLFLMLGPNTGLGHGGSTIFMSECQARYVASCLAVVLDGGGGGGGGGDGDGVAAIEVRQDVHDDYNERVDAEHAELIWTHPGMTNWYRNRHGRITALLPWRLVDYWALTHDVDLDEFIVDN
ncbi:MAG: NAD(P)-binding domain-containing protein [Actinomycetota bacterium]